MSRRLLLVAPLILHAPSNPRGIRAARLIEGLGRRGWEIDVLSYWAGEGEPAVPGARRLYALDGGNPFGTPFARSESRAVRLAHRGARALRANPEGLGAWVRTATATLSAEPRSGRPDLVLALGLPASGLLAGAEIAAALELPLVSDLGDPWNARGPAEWWARRRALGRSAALITTTEPLAEAFEPLLGPATPIRLIPAGGVIQRRPNAAEPPLFVHMGAVTLARIDPRPAWEVLTRLHDAGRIEFRSHSVGWRDDFDELPHGHRPLLDHEAALGLTGRASAALVVGNTNHEQLPSKAFELACTETWALCVSELDHDPALALLSRSGHAVRAANQPAAIEHAVAEILARESRGERPTPAPEHSWEHRYDQVAELLERISA